MCCFAIRHLFKRHDCTFDFTAAIIHHCREAHVANPSPFIIAQLHLIHVIIASQWILSGARLRHLKREFLSINSFLVEAVDGPVQ